MNKYTEVVTGQSGTGPMTGQLTGPMTGQLTGPMTEYLTGPSKIRHYTQTKEPEEEKMNKYTEVVTGQSGTGPMTGQLTGPVTRHMTGPMTEYLTGPSKIRHYTQTKEPEEEKMNKYTRVVTGQSGTGSMTGHLTGSMTG